MPESITQLLANLGLEPSQGLLIIAAVVAFFWERIKGREGTAGGLLNILRRAFRQDAKPIPTAACKVMDTAAGRAQAAACIKARAKRTGEDETIAAARVIADMLTEEEDGMQDKVSRLQARIDQLQGQLQKRRRRSS